VGSRILSTFSFNNIRLLSIFINDEKVYHKSDSVSQSYPVDYFDGIIYRSLQLPAKRK
jgi:hypothetical protein